MRVLLYEKLDSSGWNGKWYSVYLKLQISEMIKPNLLFSCLWYFSQLASNYLWTKFFIWRNEEKGDTYDHYYNLRLHFKTFPWFTHVIAQTEEFAQLKKVFEETNADIRVETVSRLETMEQTIQDAIGMKRHFLILVLVGHLSQPIIKDTAETRCIFIWPLIGM